MAVRHKISRRAAKQNYIKYPRNAHIDMSLCLYLRELPTGTSYADFNLHEIDVMLSNSASSDCLVVGESQGGSRLPVGQYPVKPSGPEGDSQSIDTYRCKNNLIVLLIINIFC